MSVFHIGIQKTATTHLQTRLFPYHPSFVGQHSPAHPVEFSVLADLARLFSGKQINPKSRTELIRTLRQIGLRTNHDVLFSFENLVRTPYLWSKDLSELIRSGSYQSSLDRWQFAPALRWLIDFFPSRTPPIFLITVREQASALASLYAQHSHRIPGASQSHFEDSLFAYLEFLGNVDCRSHLNYQFVAESIGKEFKSDQIRIVFIPIELVSSPEFLTLMAEASGLALSIEERSEYLQGPPTHTRGDGKSWPLRVQRDKKSRVFARRISLSEAMITEVKRVFSPSNRALESALTPLGLGDSYF